MEITIKRATPDDAEAMVMWDAKLSESLGKNIDPELLKKKIEWQRSFIEEGDEIYFYAKDGDKIVGFINVTAYHVEDDKRVDDQTGLISDILVDKQYRGNGISETLLMLGVDALLDHPKHIKSAIMHVQEDNEFRFLHFALADKIRSTSKCTRDNGSETTNYELFISDISKYNSENFNKRDLQRRCIKIKKQIEEGKDLRDLYEEIEKQ